MVSLENVSVLVTGGAGFIGSWLCETLLNEGALVWCLDNMSTGQWANVRHLKSHNKFSAIAGVAGDVTNPKVVDDWSIAGVDVIVNLASRASPRHFYTHPIEILNATTIGTMHMLEIARCNDARFIQASTSEIYGQAAQIPTPETYTGNVNPQGIRACYDEGKRAGEAFCMAYLRKYGVNVRIARIFNTYGPKMPDDGRAIPTFVRKALANKPLPIFGTGNQTRSFLYIKDLIKALVKMITVEGIAGEAINIGMDKETTLRELAELIIRLTHAQAGMDFRKGTEDDPMRRLPDITKAKKLLGWKPTFSLEEGMTETVRYAQSI